MDAVLSGSEGSHPDISVRRKKIQIQILLLHLKFIFTFQKRAKVLGLTLLRVELLDLQQLSNTMNNN